MKRFTILLATLCFATTAGTTHAKDPIKVYLLAGQSNMVGHGRIEEGVGGVNGAQGSLRHMATNNIKAYGHLLQDPKKAAASKWAVRDDVWVWHNNDGPERGNLTVGFGRSTINIGPEFGFGHVIGKATEEQVLLVKACWGGKSLAKDFLPPSAAEYPEPNKPIPAEIPPREQVPGSSRAYRANKGVAYPVTECVLKIDGKEIARKPVTDKDTTITFTAKLKKGSIQLAPVFITGEKGEIGCHYAVVKKK